jgi:HSP20 family protein
MINRWNPLGDIVNIHNRINRIFRDSLQGGDLDNTGDWQPPVDIFETDSEIIILAELPGTPEDAIDVQISDGVLSIRGAKPSPLEKNSDVFYRIERTSGKFSRVFAVPQGVDSSTVNASLKDGILKIVLNKSVNETPKSIKIVKQDA